MLERLERGWELMLKSGTEEVDEERSFARNGSKGLRWRGWEKGTSRERRKVLMKWYVVVVLNSR